MYRKRRRGWSKHADFMLLDIICIQIAFILSYLLRFGFDNPYKDEEYRVLAMAFLFIDFFVEIVLDSFKNVLRRGYFEEFVCTLKHIAIVEVLTVFYLFTMKIGGIYSRSSYYAMIPIYFILDYICRNLWKKYLRKKHIRNQKALLVVAPVALLQDTLETVSKSCIGYSKIVAAASDADIKGSIICDIQVVANHDEIADVTCSEWIDEVLIPPCDEESYPADLVAIFMEMGIAVHTGIAKKSSIIEGQRIIEKIGDYTVVTTSMRYASSTQLMIKRLIDIAAGLVGCLCTLLILIFIGPVIYLSSPGPIFFTQERVGRNGRKFRIYKFRSMYMDAEERKKELLALNKIGDGMMFKMDFDPRIIGNKILPDGTKKTGIGQFIRRTSLDEFPQFWNILRGDMSLVGTRPPTLDEWEKYEPHHRARMAFRPGLTGLWQVSGRSNITDFEDVVGLDIKYIYEWSLKADLQIIFKTFKIVFENEGAV